MKKIRYIRAINEALDEEFARDDRFFLVGEEVAEGGTWGDMRKLHGKYGSKRIKSTPISESAFMGLANGAAMAGLRPVVHLMFMDFVTVCMDPLVNHIAKARYLFNGMFTLPITIITTTGAGLNAGPQHSQSLEAWFAHVPGLKVVMPSTAYDAKGLLKASLRDDNPVFYIYNKTLIAKMEEIPEEEYVVPLGKAHIKREGKDVTVVATSKMVYDALSAAEKLAAEGIGVEVVDPRTISPLDIETIVASVKKTGRLVIAHEATKFMGIGAEIAAQVAETALDYLDAPIKRLGSPFCPIPASPPLEKAYIPGEADIMASVREVMGVEAKGA